MTTEAGIQDSKFEGSPPPLWIPFSVAFRLSLIFFCKLRVDRPHREGRFPLIFLWFWGEIENGGIEK